MNRMIARLFAGALMTISASAVSALQAPPPAHDHDQNVACRPVGPNEGRPGCWILAQIDVRAAGRPQYWHVYEYADMGQAARALDGHSRVVASFGRFWLLAVGDRRWRARGGRHVATVGPLQPLSSVPQTATFMQATFDPGMRSRPHVHPGPEAWVVIEGEQCLETAEGTIRGRAGESMSVRGGIPMALFGTGPVTRRSLVLILHPAGQAPTGSAGAWQPGGACLEH